MYRFNLNGTDVECDSAQELVEALGAKDAGKTPTTPKRRARKQSTGGGGELVSRNWAIARFYSQKRGVNMGSQEARSYLSKHDAKREKVEQEMIDAGLLQPLS